MATTIKRTRIPREYQSCARWDCAKKATYEKPLCWTHWSEWERWDLEECNVCHWVYGSEECIVYETNGFADEFPFLCDDCLGITLIKMGRGQPWKGPGAKKRPTLPHAPLERAFKYVYILKLSDGVFYPGQTTNLAMRLTEHRDGQHSKTKGKEPKLVYLEGFQGSRDEVNQRENELILLNRSGIGRRRIRELVEGFRQPLRLLDLEA